MSKLTALKSAKTLHDIAALLGFKASSLSFVLYKKGEAANYSRFEIPKRTGGTRSICAPAADLKKLQSNLACLLQDCAEEVDRLLKRSDQDEHPDKIAHGFKRRRSIITNARQHSRRRFVFNVDLENFFGTINFGRIRGFFIHDRNFLLTPKIATIIAQIACFEQALPQGSPCSPVIANLIGHILDIHLAKMAARAKCTYTRYADDLTFSTNLPQFPDLIASEDVKDHWVPGRELTRLITKCGFVINPKKTRMQYCGSRQEVTGLVVNKKVSIRIDYRKTARAMVHRLFGTGSFDFEHTTTDNGGTKTVHTTPGTLNQLHGILGFIDGVDLFNRKLNPSPKGAGLSSKEKIFRRFLIFKEFYATQAPVLICEGKTDNVYIAHALRSLADHFPVLATKALDESIKINIRRFRHSGSSTGRIVGLQGGSGDLANFIRNYRSETKHFKAPGMKWPVIVVIDNDDGAPGVFKAIREITKVMPAGTEPFIHVCRNLYVVATPLNGAPSSCIEDFFDTKTKGELIDGKSFSSSNDYDKSTHYGKSDFAHKIVAEKANDIDFSGFKPLFRIIEDVITDNSERHTDSTTPVP
jgi:hypothetical protein